MGGEEGGGTTICHKILLPSKGSHAWRNIPFKTCVPHVNIHNSCKFPGEVLAFLKTAFSFLNIFWNFVFDD